MNQLHRPYPFQVRPLHRETSASYARRLLAANFDTTEKHRQHLLYASGARTIAAKNAAWTELLKVKTGRTDLRLEANEHGWLRHPDGTSCSLCADLLPSRWMCTHCSHGALVGQHPHFDKPVCIRHPRWVGILGRVGDQHRASANHLRAPSDSGSCVNRNSWTCACTASSSTPAAKTSSTASARRERKYFPRQSTWHANSHVPSFPREHSTRRYRSAPPTSIWSTPSRRRWGAEATELLGPFDCTFAAP